MMSVSVALYEADYVKEQHSIKLLMSGPGLYLLSVEFIGSEIHLQELHEILNGPLWLSW